jgi:hypothetical protein
MINLTSSEYELVEVIHQNGSLCFIIVSLEFLLATLYRLNNLKISRQYKFSSELTVSSDEITLQILMFLKMKLLSF